MTVSAALSTGLADFFGNLDQIHRRVWHACGLEIFFVRSGGIVAHEAVDTALVAKVEGSVFPAITGMTARTAGPVAQNAYTEIVDGHGGLAQIYSLVLTQGEWRRAFPQPVSGAEHLLALSRMATEAFFCYLECIRLP